jgi:hypothetical protein
MDRELSASALAFRTRVAFAILTPGLARERLPGGSFPLTIDSKTARRQEGLKSN